MVISYFQNVLFMTVHMIGLMRLMFVLFILFHIIANTKIMSEIYLKFLASARAVQIGEYFI